MKWKIKPKAPNAFFKKFPEYSPLIVQMLYNRGLKTQQQIDEFFNSDYKEDIHDPFLLKGMKKAVKRILKAIEKQEKILIYGDFDADGVCSAAVLFITLKDLGVQNISTYIPDREKENHGLNEKSIQQAYENNVNLIITTDCASNDVKEVDLANSLKMDVIITDHHQIDGQMPKTVALINPSQKGDKYPFKGLSGTGVAYKLACALMSSKGKQNDNLLKKWLLDLVALATVADVESIIGENRTLVKYGLGVLAQTKWLGLKELMEVSKITPQVNHHSLNGEAPLTNLNIYTLGFMLGPRLNAAGRIGHANTAFRLLTTQDKKEAKELALRLNQKNIKRQSLTTKVFKEVVDCLDKKIDQGEDFKLIFEGSPDWPIGLVGLIAGKVKDKYCKPTIIYHQRGDLIHASCRSIPEFDLMSMLKQCAKFFDDYGGRCGTGGFRMNAKKLNQVKEKFNQIAEEKMRNVNIDPILEIDKELYLKDVDWKNYDQIHRFAPFGKANPEPRFLVKGLEISSLRVVGNNGGHLKMALTMFNKDSKIAKNFNAIGFGLGKKIEEIKKGDLIDIVFELIVNKWNGQRDLEMKIIDLKLA